MNNVTSYNSVLHRVHTNGPNDAYPCFNYGSALCSLSRLCTISKFDEVLFNKDFTYLDDVPENEYRYEMMFMLKIYDILRYGLRIMRNHDETITTAKHTHFYVTNPQNSGKYDIYGKELTNSVTPENVTYDTSHIEYQIPQIAKAFLEGQNLEGVIQDGVVIAHLF